MGMVRRRRCAPRRCAGPSAGRNAARYLGNAFAVLAARLAAAFCSCAAPFSGLSVSLLRLLFNLYLLTVGFNTLFVAKFAAINWTFHGLWVIPSPGFSPICSAGAQGLIFYSGNLLATTAVIFVTDPNLMLVLAAVIGLFEGGHAIIRTSPSWSEQSRQGERVLFQPQRRH